MNLTYFYGTASYDDAKKVYRKKVKELHPDINPTVDAKLIQELNSQWEYIEIQKPVFPIINPTVKKSVSNGLTTRAERNAAIDKMFAFTRAKGYKQMWVYFEWVAQCNLNSIKIQREDIEYIGSCLGYKEGWAYHKCLELKI